MQTTARPCAAVSDGLFIAMGQTDTQTDGYIAKREHGQRGTLAKMHIRRQAGTLAHLFITLICPKY